MHLGSFLKAEFPPSVQHGAHFSHQAPLYIDALIYYKARYFLSRGTVTQANLGFVYPKAIFLYYRSQRWIYLTGWNSALAC